MSFPNQPSPIHAVAQEVQRRYADLGLLFPFSEFRDRIAASVPSTIAATTWMMRPHVDLFKNSINPKSMGAQQVRRTTELIAELQRALLLCMIAKLPTPKPIGNVLDEARNCCARHDAHLARYAEEDETAKRCRARGGRARHEDHRRVQRLLIRFLRTMAPVNLWKSKAHAADTIGPHLCKLALKYCLKVSKCEETWVHNVVRLIRTDERAAGVFERSRAPRRTNRCRRILR